MSKKCKCNTQRSLPKRIAGVKIPKAIRRAADTPLGSALIAETMVEFGKEAVMSPPMRHALADLRTSFARAALGLAASLQHAASNAGQSVVDAAEDTPKRRRRNASARLEQEEELAH